MHLPQSPLRPLALSLVAAGRIALSAEAADAPDFSAVPGVVITHSPASSGLYIGSPALAVLPDGAYVASHDFFGPRSAEFQRARTQVFRSEDRGLSWRRIAVVEGAFWSSLFTHRGGLYLLGTDRHHGDLVIRRSTDRGESWTEPVDGESGLLRPGGECHTAPVPVLEHAGRLWRAFEWRDPPRAWGVHYQVGVQSIPVERDLLHAAHWTFSNFLPSDRAWNGGDMGAWLEGNAVADPQGQVVNLLRVQTRSPEERLAEVRVSEDGHTLTFDPATGFRPFPGAAKKFTIRRDPQGEHYWSLASILHERHRADNPGGIRNTLALLRSPDLRTWEVRQILLYHPDVRRHGFQYVDWLFDGEDLIAACRTAYDDGLGGARNNHDANFLTFHRFTGFRTRTPEGSVPLPERAEVRWETEALLVTGHGWERAEWIEGGRAFSNRDYVWRDVPASLRGAGYTRTAGGEPALVRVRAKQAVDLHLATSAPAPAGWEEIPGLRFRYTDKGLTPVSVYRKALAAGEGMVIPQAGWTGSLLRVR
jgi:hypothetical protein